VLNPQPENDDKQKKGYGMNFKNPILPQETTDRVTLVIALLIAFLTAYFLFWYQSEFQWTEGLNRIGIMKSTRSLRVRHAKSLRWGNSQTESDIFLKDMVYIPSGASAEFAWNDKKFILDPETLVQFDEAMLDSLEITLLEGNLKMDPESARFFNVVKPEAKTLLFDKTAITYLPDINPLVLKHSELTDRALTMLQKQLLLEPTRAVLSPKLFLNRLSDYQIVVRSPKKGLYRFSEKEWGNFEWIEVPLKGVKYELEMALDEDFKKSVKTKALTNVAQVLFEQPGKYYWRVNAGKSVELIQSEIEIFELNEKDGEPIPSRMLTSQPKPTSTSNIETTKAPGAKSLENQEKLKPTKPKTPYEILFGK
jgi:hypothetical protein